MQEFCFTGVSHRRADGLEVKRGESFVPTDSELSAFGDLLISVAAAKDAGIYRGPATEHSQVESVDAARARVEREEREIAERRGRAPRAEASAGDTRAVAARKTVEATRVDQETEAEEAEVEETEEVEVTRETFEAMKVAELRAYAKQSDIDVKGKRTKAELVDAVWNGIK